jgi:hypothetical protein
MGSANNQNPGIGNRGHALGRKTKAGESTMMMDNTFMRRISRVNKMRSMITDGVANAKDVLEEAERVLAQDIRWLTRA